MRRLLVKAIARELARNRGLRKFLNEKARSVHDRAFSLIVVIPGLREGF